MRVLGTIAVLMYHAGLSYLAQPMRLTLWPIHDGRGHVGFDLFVYWVNAFAMPLFFLAAGVSAPAAIGSRGARVFLQHRAGRLLRPLLFGCLTIIPFCYPICGLGMLRSGRMTLEEISSWRFTSAEVNRHLYGLGHLWFLEYLYVVCVLWAGAWWLTRRAGKAWARVEDLAGWLGRLCASPWRPIFLAVPTAAIFLLDTDTILRVENDPIPNLSRVIHYLYFFAAGGLLFRAANLDESLARFGRSYLALAAGVFVAMAPSLLRFAAAPLVGPERVVFALLAALFPWLAVLGGLGVCVRRSAGKGPVLRYLAEASFWIYMIHLPVVLMMQVLLFGASLPALAKFLLVTAVALGVSLLSYEHAARYSLIGEIVNGARKRRKVRPRLGTEFGWIAAVGVVLLGVGGVGWYLRVYIFENNYFAVAPGSFHRSARLALADLDRAIARDGLKTVIAFSSGGQHRWIHDQAALCRDRSVAFHVLPLRGDRFPSRECLGELVTVLRSSARPMLVEGYRGLDPCAFAVALGRMLEGTPPRAALDQFGPAYGQFAGAERSPLGVVLLEYDRWLTTHHRTHASEQLEIWAREHYLVDSTPALAPEGGRAVARVVGAEPTVAR